MGYTTIIRPIKQRLWQIPAEAVGYTTISPAGINHSPHHAESGGVAGEAHPRRVGEDYAGDHVHAVSVRAAGDIAVSVVLELDGDVCRYRSGRQNPSVKEKSAQSMVPAPWGGEDSGPKQEFPSQRHSTEVTVE